ncbi:MAG: hypothetical protein LBQ24_01620 [Candidatus Peribacteria bacterium]|jgi:proline dehydrogenase|nr:hypothetical protein [Candidatus Peribacteria bacterium]
MYNQVDTRTSLIKVRSVIIENENELIPEITQENAYQIYAVIPIAAIKSVKKAVFLI